jgi:hypothetical protein
MDTFINSFPIFNTNEYIISNPLGYYSGCTNENSNKYTNITTVSNLNAYDDPNVDEFTYIYPN